MTIIEKIKAFFVGDNNPLPTGNVEGPVKRRDFSYQGEGMPGIANTHDECGAVPVTKTEETQAAKLAER